MTNVTEKYKITLDEDTRESLIDTWVNKLILEHYKEKHPEKVAKLRDFIAVYVKEHK